MNILYDITKELNLLFCVNNEDVQTQLYSIVEEEFQAIERTSPELLCKYINKQHFDLLILDKNIRFDEELRTKIESIQHNHPKTVIMAEVDTADTVKLLQTHEMAIDRVILYPATQSAVHKLLERTFHSRYELVQNEKYEHHLEDIIFGQTRQLHSQETVDSLTGLENSTSMKKRFIKKGERSLLFLDVDNFDTINTLYGMMTGDKVLYEIAKRLEKFLRSKSEVFRLSADEFAIVAEGSNIGKAQELGDEIIALFNEACVVVDKIKFDIGFSIGFDVGSSYEVFHNAKLANREAKSLGGRKCVRYNSSSAYLLKQKENFFWTNEIKDALKNDRIIVYYQPILDLENNSITKYEALARIENKKGEIITPNFFIGPAITAHLISSLTRVIIDKSFKEFKKNDFNFSINISEQDFSEEYLVDFLNYKCDYYDIDPARVFLEILEETTINNSELFEAQIKSLKKLGFKFSIDDFGVEKSNFSRVMAMNADIIKIDGSFIRTLKEDKNSSFIIESIVVLAQKMGAKTVAEYVEDASTLKSLKKMGVDFAQGYYIGEPKKDLLLRD